MSGFQTQVLTPITYGQPLPANQTPKTIQFSVLWNASNVKANNNSIDINLLQQYQTNQFTTCMTVYIDNSTNPNPVTLTCDQTQQSIFCAGFAEGCFPIIASFQPSFTAQTFPFYDEDSASTELDFSTNFYFMNVPMPHYYTPLTNAVSINNSFTQSISDIKVYPITPNNTTVKLKTILYSFDVSISFLGTLPANEYVIFNICEIGSSNGGDVTANSYTRFNQQFQLTSITNVFSFSKTYNPPLITRNNNASNSAGYNNLGIYFDNVISGVTYVVAGNVSYGLIQTG